MTFDLVHIWAEMSLLAKAIAGVLFMMAIACIGVVLERLWALSRHQKASRIFVKAIKPHLEHWDIDAVRVTAKSHKASFLARLFGAISRRYLYGHAVGADGGLSPVEMARNECKRAEEAVGASLRRGMSVLASVGSVAPFVGLLGTVVGIISAFKGIAAHGSGGLAAVSASIAEALIETAGGLMVAIPVVLAYNYLTGRVSQVERKLARSAGELLDDMEYQDGRVSGEHQKLAA